MCGKAFVEISLSINSDKNQNIGLKIRYITNGIFANLKYKVCHNLTDLVSFVLIYLRYTLNVITNPNTNPAKPRERTASFYLYENLSYIAQ